MDKLEKKAQKLWIKVYAASIKNGRDRYGAETYANNAVHDFKLKFEK